MIVRVRIRRGDYRDSVTLMQIAQRLTQQPDVHDAAVVMATDANKAILRQARLHHPDLDAATANDLVAAVRAETEAAASEALQLAESSLAHRSDSSGLEAHVAPRSIRAASRSYPQSNLAVISVAGRYAADEAWEALKCGLHVFLFSDNVSVDDEVALKKFAATHGLLMMGPGCGTSIINGVGLGFANQVPRGPVGIVAAAGTGLQEVSTQLAKLGVGISQAIGTGGRDLIEPVGGITSIGALSALEADPDTRVMVMISKPPSPAVAQAVLSRVRECSKPTVVCFLGGDPEAIVAAGAIPARTLQEAASLAAGKVQGPEEGSAGKRIERETEDLRSRAAPLAERLAPSQQYLRGLYSGGTLAAEALIIWKDLLGDVRSNVALEPRLLVSGTATCTGHAALDMGEEEFTLGRPHPMIDNTQRISRMLQEADDATVAVVILDVVLGHGAHPDPGSELGPAVRLARERAASEGRSLAVVASITGTDADPQNLSYQARALEEAGAVVCTSNADAARLAAHVIGA
jgi:FdrA protein